MLRRNINLKIVPNKTWELISIPSKDFKNIPLTKNVLCLLKNDINFMKLVGKFYGYFLINMNESYLKKIKIFSCTYDDNFKKMLDFYEFDKKKFFI
jgi:hypothetical protein